jgi:hypothetical protein
MLSLYFPRFTVQSVEVGLAMLRLGREHPHYLLDRLHWTVGRQQFFLGLFADKKNGKCCLNSENRIVLENP